MIARNFFRRSHYLKSLIIVESPTKAKTIKNFLGSEYEVIASKGHIRDLPKSSFGIKIENEEFKPEYRISKEHSSVVKEIKELAKKSEKIYIATDEDREGEAIGYHIAYAIGKDPQTLPRIVFHEITKKAITHSLENPRLIDMDKVNAQQARRLLDRIVGYKLSPLLSSKIQKGLSAGRVQSSALKLLVDREKEIREFKPVEYYSINALFNPNIESLLVSYKNEKIEKLTIQKKELADEIVATVNTESFKVDSIEIKKRKSSTPPPFMTSTLQQVASSQLGFSPRKTMMIAQSLYEGVKTDQGTMGVITYMRTDSLNLAKEAVDGIREMIGNTYGEKYLPRSAKNYVTKSKAAQEAHEAIRPTLFGFTPEKSKSFLKPDEQKLYTLIYNRFMACQMTDAEFESQTILFTSPSTTFKASGRKLVFDGFYKVLGSEDKDKLLPELKQGEPAKLEKIEAIQHFTEPPSRFSEASLIKKMESLGIGRPSTYAPTINLLQNRNYVEIEKKQLVPQEIAFTVTDVLETHFNEIVDSGFTANMEETLDQVADQQSDWQKVLQEFYTPFMDRISSGKENIKSLKIAIPTGEKCPLCGEELLERSGRFGKFIACSAYPKCKYTKQLGETEKPEEELSEETCEKCGKPMVVKNGRNGKFLACSGYPECKNTRSLGGKPSAKVLGDVKCPECGGDIIQRNSRRGVFFGCSNYPKCKFISNFAPTNTKCGECGYLMAERTYRKKEVYECIKCKHREERTPSEKPAEDSSKAEEN